MKTVYRVAWRAGEKDISQESRDFTWVRRQVERLIEAGYAPRVCMKSRRGEWLQFTGIGG